MHNSLPELLQEKRILDVNFDGVGDLVAAVWASWRLRSFLVENFVDAFRAKGMAAFREGAVFRRFVTDRAREPIFNIRLGFLFRQEVGEQLGQQFLVMFERFQFLLFALQLSLQKFVFTAENPGIIPNT